MLSLRQQRTIGSSKCLWDLCFHVGQRLTSRLTVAAGGKYERGSTNDGHPVLVLDRSGLAMITDRVDIRVKLGALVPYWEPHEFVFLTPLLLKNFRYRWRLAVRVLSWFPSCIKIVNTLSSTGSDLSCVVEARGVTFLVSEQYFLYEPEGYTILISAVGVDRTLMAAPERGRGRGRDPHPPMIDEFDDGQ
ncbi:hypothetical protein PIB30_091157 [Stylosanthes scabra]|uniref:Uncharacterized protein n=1 Tax=Stylosanthes scabra TaxID=79078 RepID=A0ABU6RVF0_9FABA|nr:hypothetical protein [Stylosanthes scabra]